MSPIRMERVESAVRVVIAFVEAFNRHDVPTLLDLMSDDCSFECASPAPDGSTYKGKPALTEYWQAFFARIPRSRLKVEETFGLGLRCLMRWQLEWLDAGGNTTHLRGVDIFRVQNGLIVEHWSYVKG